MSDGTENNAPRTSNGPHPQVRALCCQCGNVRATSTYQSSGEPSVQAIDFFARIGEPPPGRCLVRRKCRACRQRTVHALLRDDLSSAQRAAQEAPLSEKLSPVVTSLIDGLRECDVRVWWESEEALWRPGQVAVVRQWLDDNSWHVELNAAAHVVHLAAALEVAWSTLATAGSDVGGGQWRSVAGTPDDPDYPPCRYSVIGLPA